MRNLVTIGLAVLAVLALAAPASAEFVSWAEVGDAGALPDTAQAVTGLDPSQEVRFISGNIANPGDQDVYLIFISNPAAFSATTVGQPGTLFDTQLFLFTQAGFGVEANDEAGPVGTGRSALPAGNPNSPTVPGLYLLAISSFNNNPVSPGGLLIFPEPSGIGATVGPTGPGGGEALSGWTGTGFSAGSYTIELTGVNVGPDGVIPEPGSIVLLSVGVAGLAGHGYRRWRRAA